MKAQIGKLYRFDEGWLFEPAYALSEVAIEKVRDALKTFAEHADGRGVLVMPFPVTFMDRRTVPQPIAAEGPA